MTEWVWGQRRCILGGSDFWLRSLPFSDMGAVDGVGCWPFWLAEGKGMGGSLRCVEFKVHGTSKVQPTSSRLYNLELQRVVRMGESELWVAVGTVDLISQREDVGEERALGKNSIWETESW